LTDAPRADHAERLAGLVDALVVVLTGWLHGLCFPPTRLHALAWVVLVPALVIFRRASLGRAVALAALLALAGAVATVDWLPRTVATYYGRPVAVGIALFLGVTLVFVVPSLAAFAACYQRLGRLPGALLPLLAAAAWVTCEFGRARVFTGNPWVLIGYSQVGVPWVMQLADVASVYGIGFVVVAVDVALAEAWIAWRAGRPRDGAGGVAVACIVLVVTLAYGAWRLARPDAETTPAVPVAVAQANLDLGTQWRRELYGQNLDAYLRLTSDALRARPRLVVWPENAMTFFLEDEPLYQASIARVLAPGGMELLAGGPQQSDPAHPTYHNSAFVLGPDGAPRARYDKQHLLPFAEYFPFPTLDFLARSFGRVREFTPGRDAAPLPTVAGPAGVLICNEALFPEIARERVRNGAAWLANLTNDTWVGDRKYAEIAFDMATLRAVEQHRWLVRASTAGPSAIVDPNGRVTAATPLFTKATTAGAIVPQTGLTPYARLGDAFPIACVVTTLAALLVRRT
jgi:apolipoprotein N-acyltransferase